MRYWQIGSKWSNDSLLEIFKEHGVVFFGSDCKVHGDHTKVKKGDIIFIRKSQTLLAKAIVESEFKEFSHSHPLWDKLKSYQKTMGTNKPVYICYVQIKVLPKDKWVQVYIRNRFTGLGPKSLANLRASGIIN